MENQTPSIPTPLPKQDIVAPQTGNKEIIFGLGIVILIVVVAVSWFLYTTTTTKLYPDKITIGYVDWPGYLALFLAEDKGYLQEAGLDVDLKLYSEFQELSDDYVAGKIQGKVNISLDAVAEAYRGLDHKIVLAIDYSNGADAIISSPQITSFKDIKGKKVGYDHGSHLEFLLIYALQQNDLSIKDIQSFNLDPKSAAEALVDGTVDVAVTYEPFLSPARNEIKGNIIYSSADAPGLVTDILSFRTEFIEENPETIDAIVQAYFKGLNFWKSNPAEANALIGKRLGVSGQEVSIQLLGISMLDEQDNQTAFIFAAGFESIYGNMRRTGDFIRPIRYPESPKLDTDQLVDDRFIRKLSR